MTFLLNLIRALIYGIVQGITEWLPISSTAHLILMRSFMPLNVFDDFAANQAYWELFKVVIQLGSTAAVILYFKNRLNPFSTKLKPARKKSVWRLWLMILIACVPTGVAGVLLDDPIDRWLSSSWIIALMLVVYGGLFIWMEQRNRKPVIDGVGKIQAPKAFLTGCFQSLALIPGTSRSGATIFGETLLGFDRETAVEFSFMVAIPTMLGASLLKIVKYITAGNPLNFSGAVVLMVGCVSTFAVSMVAIRYLLQYIRSHDFKIFGIYRIILGIVVLAFTVAGIII